MLSRKCFRIQRDVWPDSGYMSKRRSVEVIFGRILHLFCAKVDSDPESIPSQLSKYAFQVDICLANEGILEERIVVHALIVWGGPLRGN